MRKVMVFVAALSVALFACKDDPPPAPKSEPKKPQPVPSDFVMNDFFTEETKVKGVQGDGGSVNLGADAAGGGGGEKTTTGGPGDPNAAKLIEPGADPKAPKRYVFAAGKGEVRVGQMRATMNIEVPGAPPQQQAQPALELTMKFSTKGAQKGSFPFEVKLEKVGLAEGQGLDPRMAAQAQKELSPLVGTVAKFDVTARGNVGEMSVAGDEKMAKEGAAAVLDSLQQVLEFVTVPFPEEPIGVGAKWEVTSVSASQGTKVTTATTFVLKEWTGDAGTITADIVRSAPKAPLRDPRMPGAQLQISGKGSYTFTVKTDRPTQKLVGETTTIAKIEVPGKGDKAAPQVIVQTVKTKHTLDAPSAK
jgi:hypothetical protein